MRAFLDDSSLIHRNDAVRAAHSRKAVRDNQHGAVAADGIHICHDGAFRFIIERTRRFIQNQNTWIRYQCAGDGNTLPLPAGKPRALFADHGVITLAQFHNKIMRPGQFRCLNHPLQRHPRIRKGDIVAHAGIHQHILLQHHPHLAT